MDEQILSFLKNNKAVIIATVYKKSGSVPRGPGAKLIVSEDNQVFGTIGGGQVENKVINFSKDFFNKKEQAEIIFFNLEPGKNGENYEMICGGRIWILIEKVLPTIDNIKLFEKALNLSNQNQKSIWLIDISKTEDEKTATRKIITENENNNIDNKLSDKIFINNNLINKTQVIELDNKIFFIDPFSKKEKLILIGSGHVSTEVAKLASTVGFHICVMDDRKELANKQRFPTADEIIVLNDFNNIFQNIDIHSNTYIVILTRGHIYDQTVLEQSLNTKAAYIGMIGSKKKRNTIYENLLRKGISEKLLKTVYCPIGLNIGAQTPEEIAVSIVAELIQARNK